MMIYISLKPNESAAFYDALFKATSADNVSVFDGGVFVDNEFKKQVDEELDYEDEEELDDSYDGSDPCPDEDVPDFSDLCDADNDDEAPLYMAQMVVHLFQHPTLLSCTLQTDMRVRFVAYDTVDDCNVLEFCVEDVSDFLPKVRASLLYPYARQLYNSVCAYIRTELKGEYI